MSERVVIWDPKGEVQEGELIDGNAAKVFEARGGVALPILPPLVEKNGAAGWVKRCFGDGVVFGMTQNRRGCPLVFYASTHCGRVHWAACLVAAEKPDGRLRLVGDGGQVGVALSRGGVASSATDLTKLDGPGVGGGWIARGESRVTVAHDGFVALGLYGSMNDVRVRWLAVSQSR